MKPRSISIFLPDGDPDSFRTAQIAMSTIHAMAFRRSQWKEARGLFDELGRPGVYILIGDLDPDDGTRRVYVGESENVSARINKYASARGGNDLHPFWSDTVVLTSKDQSLTKSHARYIEARLIGEASGNPRWRVANTQGPEFAGKLPLVEAAAMEEFIDQTKTLCGALGFDVFKITASSALGNIHGPENCFTMSGSGYSARMKLAADGEFLVLKGSVARATENASLSAGVKATRNLLIERGILTEDQGGLSFATDQAFPSATAAASVVYGGSINGRAVWKTAAGTNYGDWEAERAEELD
ncbi:MULTISPECIES: GIY-YIG nuclease family protein [Hyphobacterium]|jgi:hypothetical protein|uniref:GIY-YIG nuclease family protein n=1 Tax=Hyphobacterium vulgare TaxID=1736751 RepID=A0ABV6ZW13_9PROT